MVHRSNDLWRLGQREHRAVEDGEDAAASGQTLRRWRDHVAAHGAARTLGGLPPLLETLLMHHVVAAGTLPKLIAQFEWIEANIARKHTVVIHAPIHALRLYAVARVVDRFYATKKAQLLLIILAEEWAIGVARHALFGKLSQRALHHSERVGRRAGAAGGEQERRV